MYDVFLFAGTTEGRILADRLKELERCKVCCFTATEYGKSLIAPGKNLDVRSGRLTEEEMLREIRENTAEDAVVIDATHPYAAAVTENIRKACDEAGRRYVRVLRGTTLERTIPEDQDRVNPAKQTAQMSQDRIKTENQRSSGESAGSFSADDCYELPDGNVVVGSTEEAAAWLTGTQGNVLLTTGSKELGVFTSVPDYRERFYARVLSLPAVVASCAALGFQGKNLICMQGPFSEEMNIALIHQTRARYLVTKDTGREGGFPEKESAAKACGCRMIIIRRPLEEKGISVEECVRQIREAERI